MNNELVKASEKNLGMVIDSREVAEMCEKEHKHLMRDIRNFVEVLGQSNIGHSDFFVLSTYINAQNKEQPCYLLTKKGCDMVANKTTGTKGIIFTAKYVTKFEEMEKQLKLQIRDSYMIEDPVARAKRWIEEQEEKQKLSLELEAAKPKIEFAEAIESTDKVISMGDMAKLCAKNGIKIGRNRLFEFLRDMKILNSNNVPYQRYMGWFEVTESVKLGKLCVTSLVTPKGQIGIVNLVKKKY